MFGKNNGNQQSADQDLGNSLRSMLSEVETKSEPAMGGFSNPAMGAPMGSSSAEPNILSLRQDTDLDKKLKKNMLGYSKASVRDYVDQLNRSSEQMQLSLEKQIRSLSAECSRLTSESDVLRKQLSQVDAEKNMARNELDAAISAREEAEQRISDSEAELQDLQQRLADMASIEYSDSDQSEELAETREKLQKALADLDASRYEVEEQRAESLRQTELVQSYKDQLAQMKEDMDYLQNRSPEEIGTAPEELLEFSQKIYTLESANAEIKEQLSGSEAEKEKLQADLAEATRKNEELQSMLQDASNVYDEMQEKLMDAARKNEEASMASQSAIDQKTAELQAELERMRLQAADAENKIIALQSSNDILKETTKNLQEEISGFQSEKEKNDSMYMEKENRNLALEDELKRFRTELDEKKAQNEALMQSLEEEKMRVTSSRDELMNKYSELHEQYRNAVERGDLLATENEAVSELLEQYQIKEREYALLHKKDEAQKQVISDQEQAVSMLLGEMEKQLKLFEQIEDAHRNGNEIICKLTKEKSSLQIENVDLQEKIEALMGQLTEQERENLRLNRQLSLRKEPEKVSDKLDELSSALQGVGDMDNYFSDEVKKAKEISKAFSLNNSEYKAPTNY